MRILSSSGKKTYGLQDIIVKFEQDIDKIVTDSLAIGSTAYASKDRKKFILNEDKEWDFIGGYDSYTPSDNGDYDGGNLNPEGDLNDPTYDGGNLNPIKNDNNINL